MTQGFCPTCGASFDYRYVTLDPDDARRIHHRCNPRTLAGIDAAHRREPDAEEPRRKPYGQRLSDGFRILGED
jgi:hypothetical protein